MDFARKIGKSEKPQIWKTRDPFVTIRDNLLSEDTSFSEDRRFVNWKKWLAERRKQTRRVESVTGRSQADQVQNSTERFRAFVEMKDLMEHAAGTVFTDKYRSGPEFWRTPEFLPNRGDTCLPEISLTPSRKDLNLRPDLMHVGLPDLMAKERALASQKEEFWKRSEYLKTRKLELAEELALLLPKEPETATLAIQGRAYERKKLPLLRIPPVTITEPDEDEPRGAADQAAVLRIQDREFVWHGSPSGRTEPVGTEPIVWSLTFAGKPNERIEREIVLENKGTHVITYYWRYSPFRTYGVSLERRGSPFFFNKTNGLILPGQIVRLGVWYRSGTRGVFTEFWRFVTEPKLSPSTFVFRFWGCATDIQDEELTDRQTIDEYLNRCVRDSMIRSIVEEIMTRVEHSELLEPPRETSLSQSDLFVSQNPYHHYHPGIVMQLQAIYFDVAGKSTPAWNLSLDTLRGILLRIENINYKRDMLARFNKLCKQSLRPRLIEPDIAYLNKYDAAYNILCAFANLFENESELVKRNSLTREEPATPMEVEEKLTPVSQRSNNSSLEIYSKKISDQSETILMQKEEERSNLNLQSYREIFFIRIYKALEETIERVCSTVDSFHRLNELRLKI
ncbi:PREDICTED: MYCBP-associated protein-like [Vollenhovia emeryi]|uniref:MYCBP-associated protein-like n=1 Tax=Vollenhovia emeryi TaxID=411798 RepID=UPI0005F474A1|nr:PREDICTED: MYCBP-associated protein-like [Vollenhovia emeryi]